MIGTSTLTGGPRHCDACGEDMGPNDPDACIGVLPGVIGACCGHGDNARAYVAYEDDSYLDGIPAMDAMGLPTYRPPKGE